MSKVIKADLHIHSKYSIDGRMELEEIATLAKARGLDGIAVCDHGDVLKEVPQFDGLLLIPGTEVSTDLGHMLGLFVRERVETRDPFRAAELIHAQGGLAILAHPFEHSRDAERLLALLPHLDGIETYNSRAERKIFDANALAANLAAGSGLASTAGSDAHVPREVGNAVTEIEAEEPTLEGVRAAILAGRTRVSGRRGPSIYAASSQLTKLKKSGAGLKEYIMWPLFAAKCCALDALWALRR